MAVREHLFFPAPLMIMCSQFMNLEKDANDGEVGEENTDDAGNNCQFEHVILPVHLEEKIHGL